MQNQNDISIEELGFKIDENKNFYHKRGNDLILIDKLKKDIYKMIAYEGNTYFIDTFGDCFQIKEKPIFIFGILSQPCYFNVVNNRIYSIDKYSRAWIHDLEGEILNVSFLKEKIINVRIFADYCSVTTDGKPLVIDYYEKIDKENCEEKCLMIFDRSFELLRSIRVDKILEYHNTHISAIVDGKSREFSVKDHNARKSLKLETDS